MSNCQRLYLKMFNAATDAIEFIRAGNSLAAVERLVSAQRECEQLYIDADPAPGEEPDGCGQ